MKQKNISENPNTTRVDLDNGQAMVTIGGHQLQVSQKDASDAASGCPTQLMVGALGACIMLTLNAVARNKGIVLNQPQVVLDHTRQKNGGTRFQVALKLDTHLSERERKILFQSARICEVGKILKGDVQIEYQLDDGMDTVKPEAGFRDSELQPVGGAHPSNEPIA